MVINHLQVMGMILQVCYSCREGNLFWIPTKDSKVSRIWDGRIVCDYHRPPIKRDPSLDIHGHQTWGSVWLNSKIYLKHPSSQEVLAWMSRAWDCFFSYLPTNSPQRSTIHIVSKVYKCINPMDPMEYYHPKDFAERNPTVALYLDFIGNFFWWERGTMFFLNLIQCHGCHGNPHYPSLPL